MPALRPFQVFVKPAGAACNLSCRYCYYLRTDALGRPSVAGMAPDLLERYIVQHVDASPDEEVAFSWHGGEPTLLGLPYFRHIVALQRRHVPAGRRRVNGIQTNGVLLDDDWCRFFADEQFRVGLSLDGPMDVHDAYRVTRGGAPTHARVMQAFERLQRFHVSCDVLCAVHRGNAGQPARVYRFFRSIGTRSLGLLPVVERQPGLPAGVTTESVDPQAYGAFLCTVFDLWRERDAQRIAVQLFDEATRPARGLAHSLCTFRETCGDVPVVERDGRFYCCDHFVDAAHCVGNIRDDGLRDLLEDDRQRAFGEAKRTTLPARCRTCDVLAMCNGGCPKDRFASAPDGEEGLNYLCPAFIRFFRHVNGFARQQAADQKDRGSLEHALRMTGAPAQTTRMTGRNDPCPCGSGRKYKKCCLDRG